MEFTVNSPDFNYEISPIEIGEVSLYRLTLTADKPTVPHNIQVHFCLPSLDIYSLWGPLFKSKRTPELWALSTESRISIGAPVLSLMSKSGKNRLTVALDDAKTAALLSAGVNEYTGEYTVRATLFTSLSTAITQYSVIIRLDTRDMDYTEVLCDVEKWWAQKFPPCKTPEYAKVPLFSTWYNFHQKLSTDEVLRQCKMAADLGMKCVILDDGWQTENNGGAYSYCGDWELATGKIPDMKALANGVQALGMKFMIWYSVPFVGIYSKNFERFKGKYLTDPFKPGTRAARLKAAVLDPRFKECRDFLVGIYAKAVKEWELDGLKLDFIDDFVLTEDSSTDYDNMDCICLEDAVELLIDEINTVLKAINPEILIEFRQKYIGPVIRKLGNMLRVSDCPNGAMSNRMGTIDLRLISGKTAVHSDMVMWHYDENVESAAYQLINVLYSVPQVSMMIDKLSVEHRKMLAFYLAFWNENKNILLSGTLTALNPEACYSLVKAELNGDAVITAFSRCDVSLRGLNSATVVNGTDEEYIYIDSEREFSCTVLDCMGNEVSRGNIPCGVTKITVPKSGMIKLV